jgi:hypothetical protein
MDVGNRMDELVRLAERQASALDAIRNLLIGFTALVVLGGLVWIALLRG